MSSVATAASVSRPVSTTGATTLRVWMVATAAVQLAAYAVIAIAIGAGVNTFVTLPVQIALIVLSAATFTSLMRNQAEPFYWGVGYIAGLAVFMILGQVLGGDPKFFGMLFTVIATLVAVVAAMTWVGRLEPISASA